MIARGSGSAGLKSEPQRSGATGRRYPPPVPPADRLHGPHGAHADHRPPGHQDVFRSGGATPPNGRRKGSSGSRGGRVRYAQILLAVGFGLMFAAVSLAVDNVPADGPTATLAEEVMDDPLFVIKSPERPTPTMMSSQMVEAPPTTLNPNALFVSPLVGSNDNGGTDLAAPLQSLQLALDRVQPGETIYLMDGRYSDLNEPGNAHYVARNGGSPDAWVRIENAPGHSPEIVAIDGNGLEIQADYVEVIGLRVRGEGFDPNGNPWGNGILVRDSHHVHLAGNEISDMPSNGISAVESSNIAVVNNEVYDNAFWNTAQNSGISFWHSRDQGEPPDADGYHDRIIGNRVYRNENKVRSQWHEADVVSDGNGIIIDEGLDTGYNGRILILNNEVFDNGGRAVLVYQSVNVDIFFNTTYRNGRSPKLLGGPTELAAGEARNVRFINNLVWPLDGAVALRTRETNNIETAGNLVITSGDPGIMGSADTITTEAPGLVNPSIDENEADFRLKPGSSAIGAAVPVSPSVKYDRDGNERAQAPPTVGAYILVGEG